jgi:hypothetical protein
MRSVHTVGSVHAQRARTSPARLVLADTASGWFSPGLVFTPSTFLSPFAPPPFRGFLAPMGTLTPRDVRLFGSLSMNTALTRPEVSLLHTPDLPPVPSPPTP